MLQILLLSTRTNHLRSFAESLSSDPEVCLEQVASATEALSIVRTKCPHLVVVDFGPQVYDSLELVRQMIGINAMVNTAVVSPLPEPEFHEKSEGLGILGRLPVDPGADDSKALTQKLRNVLGMA